MSRILRKKGLSRVGWFKLKRKLRSLFFRIREAGTNWRDFALSFGV